MCSRGNLYQVSVSKLDFKREKSKDFPIYFIRRRSKVRIPLHNFSTMLCNFLKKKMFFLLILPKFPNSNTLFLIIYLNLLFKRIKLSYSMTTNHFKVKKWKFEFVRHETKEPNKTIFRFLRWIYRITYFIIQQHDWFLLKRHYRILLNLYLIAFAIGIEEKICPGNTWVLHDNQVLHLTPSCGG